jgi:hypothetical protein
MVLGITVRDRQALELWFFGACDGPDFERRLQENRDKAATRQRRSRAGRRTGRQRGRPKLELTADEKKARRNAQAAERMKRYRLRKNPSRTIKNINPVTHFSVTPSPILVHSPPTVPARAPKSAPRPDDMTDDELIVDGGVALARRP